MVRSEGRGLSVGQVIPSVIKFFPALHLRSRREKWNRQGGTKALVVLTWDHGETPNTSPDLPSMLCCNFICEGMVVYKEHAKCAFSGC